MRGHPEPDSRVQLPPFLRLRFTLAAKRPGRLPPYLGSLLRGAFGRALRRTSWWGFDILQRRVEKGLS